MPASDAPDSAAGDISLAYYDTDAVKTITQGGTTTSFALDIMGRRLTQTVTGASPSTMTRHYGDSSDNPTWVDDNGQVTRYSAALGGDLLATLTAGGDHRLSLGNPHGDAVTSYTIPTTGRATGILAWSDYTEYGTPRTPTAQAPVAGKIGYGWLGTKERSTTAAGLTLMGERVYNPITGRFTSLDPVYGGNHNTYTYPTDPVNVDDLDGRCPWCLIGIGIAVRVGGRLCIRYCMRYARVGWRHASRSAMRWGKSASAFAGRRYAAAKHFIVNGNHVLRIGSPKPGLPFRVSVGTARNHWNRMPRWRQNLQRLHIHVDRKGFGISWHVRSRKKSYRLGKNW